MFDDPFSDAEAEMWKPVPEYEGLYEVSNLGRVRSVDRVVVDKNNVPKVLRGRVLKHTFDRQKERVQNAQVVLSRGGVTTSRTVHSLVLEAFVGPRPDGMEACHFPDKSHENNRLDNLRWDTYQGNRNDMKVHGTTTAPKTSMKGSSNSNSSLTEPDVIEIRRIHVNEGLTHKQIASRFSVSEATIQHLLKGRTWKHVS